MSTIVRAIKHVGRTTRQLISSSRMYRYTAILSAVLVILMIIIPFWKLLPMAQEKAFIPLHYNIYFGIDRLGPWYQIFALPAIGLSLLIINTIFQAVFFHHGKMLSYFFAVTTVIAQLSLFVSLIFIMLMNV